MSWEGSETQTRQDRRGGCSLSSMGGCARTLGRVLNRCPANAPTEIPCVGGSRRGLCVRVKYRSMKVPVRAETGERFLQSHWSYL
jgi:hypothetical protein